jgi:hypothetical protein
MDLFAFSIPYLAEQVTNMLFSLVGRGGALDKLSPKHEAKEVDFKKMLDANGVEDEEKKK